MYRLTVTMLILSLAFACAAAAAGCGKSEDEKPATEARPAGEPAPEKSGSVLLEPGKPVIFELDPAGDDAPQKAGFRIRHDGKLYQMLKVAVPSESARLYLDTRQEVGKLSVLNRRSRNVYARDGSYTLVDDIPQLAGEYKWRLEPSKKAPVQKVTVTLIEGNALPEPSLSDRLGAIRVKGVDTGRARAIPDNTAWGKVSHSELSGSGAYQADMTPEGDALFWLPPGLWTVRVLPDKRQARRALSISAQLVPVRPDKITVVDLPSLQGGEQAAGAGTQVKILSVDERGQRAVMRLSVLGKGEDRVLPTRDNLDIFEGRKPGKVLRVDRPKSPLNLVILLDSSGSMKGQMRAVIESASGFIRALPADARVKVVDFDTRPRFIDAPNRSALVRKLSGVRANGATALNDSVIAGLKMLAGQERTALIAFTDGYDANHNDTGPGSKATPEDMFAMVGKASVPIFSIGYGKKPDTKTLTRIADLSGGLYYDADQASLEEVFKRINVNLGNTFDITYERPATGGSSDVPVVAVVVDNSGSMNRDPSRQGCDFRLQKVKRLLHSFVSGLPENTVAQITGFNENNRVYQVATTDKAQLSRGISRLQADGGTDILGALEHAWQTLVRIPSSRRFLVFITDAALEVEKDDKEKFDILLGKLKDRGITTLWIGILSPGGDQAPFEYAADLSGGEAVVTGNPDDLASAFDRVVSRVTTVDEEPAGETAVKAVIRARHPDGRRVVHSASGMFDLEPRKVTSGVEVPNVIDIRFVDMPRRYGTEEALAIWGTDQPFKDVRLTKRIPLDVAAENDAVRIHLDELYVFSRFRGIDSGSRRRFVAARMTLENILPAQKVAIYPSGSRHPASWVGRPPAGVRYTRQVPPYLIRNLASHLSCRFNGGNEKRISRLTWITEEPLMTARDSAVMVPPDGKVTGTVMFVAEGSELEQASLHFYDTAYGHIDMPLVGAMPQREADLTRMPKGAPARLSDAFQLRPVAVTDTRELAGIEAPEGVLFRVVDLDLISRVQANLNFDAAERVFLRIPTPEGPLFVRPHPVGAHIPMGFHQATLLAPGSHNRMRLAFVVPASLSPSGPAGDIVVELAKKDVVVGLGGKDKQAGPPKGKTFRGDGIDLTINRTGVVGKLDGRGADLLAVDFTLADAKDGQSTQLGRWLDLRRDDCEEVPAKKPRFSAETVDREHKGLRRFGKTLKEEYDTPPQGEKRLWPHRQTSSRLFGMTFSTVVPDGHRMRAVVLFENPQKASKDHDWFLRSSIFGDLKIRVGDEKFPDDQGLLLVQRADKAPKYDIDSFEDKLAEVLRRLQRERRARGWQKPGHVKRISVDATGGMEAARAELPVPSLTIHGARAWRKIEDLFGLLAVLGQIEYRPAAPGPGPLELRAGSPWDSTYAPEAVLTQGWGSESDFARMAAGILKRQGLEFESLEWSLTEAGRKEIEKRGGRPTAEPVASVPGLRYQQDGETKTIVMPFLKPATELDGFLEGTGSEVRDPRSRSRYHLRVEISAVPRKGDARAAKADAATALAGGSGSRTKTFKMLDVRLPAERLSLGAVDIGYVEMATDKGKQVVAVFDGPDGRELGRKAGFDPETFQAVAEKIEIRGPDGEKIPALNLTFKDSIRPTDRFHSLGINLPDLTGKTAATLEEQCRWAQSEVKARPDDLSVLRWYTHSLLAGFVARQSRFERETAKRLQVKRGRTVRGRILIATVERDGQAGILRTHLDLRRAADQVYAAKPEAARAYNLMNGLFSARLEANLLDSSATGLAAVSAIDIFERAFEPGMLMVNDRNRAELVKVLREQKAPPAAIERIRSSRGKTLLVPYGRAEIGGEKRLAWLEFGKDTGEVRAVLDTGGHAAATERTLLDYIHDTASYVIGFFVGIDVSLWGVSAFSLQDADYERILDKAEKFASKLAGRFGDIGTDPRWSPGDMKWKVGEDGTPELDPGWEEDYRKFVSGYKDGVKYYFALARN